ncbi:hypothetical protein LUZ61_016658 [Rhynchospora tenuis]|uniref:RING-type domain-containing protein n=1 Tax=Rhynchospora tenuis TaxID=198213 RepID=A0AAD5Z5Z0_9POAL|nr:hypothetical protein LUZ61_016658 [Rhynchospora tenuis]
MGVSISRKLQPHHCRTVDQVTESLAQAGLKSVNLIVGIDFTRSNEWTGKHAFHGRNLHHTSNSPNPYEHAISIIGHTLSRFNGDNLIPCYGFGDESTQAQDVFSFFNDDCPCSDHNEILRRYRELVPHVKLAGPTSFAPIIEMAMTIVEKSGGQYHVLLIIADGQVLFGFQMNSYFGELNIGFGVGDGPWDTMKQFIGPFHHFQFVNFTEIMSKNLSQQRKEADFAFRALMGIPSQCLATIGHGTLGRQTGRSPNKVALPPPGGFFTTSYPPSPPFSQPTAPPYSPLDNGASSSESNVSTHQQFVCPVCLVKLKDMAFGCGHQTCVECSRNLQRCPICRDPIQTRIKLY